MAVWNADAPDVVTPAGGGGGTGTFQFTLQSPMIAAYPPITQTYFMAAFDTLGNRYFWENGDATFTNAPTPAGTYVSSTLVIEGMIATH